MSFHRLWVAAAVIVAPALTCPAADSATPWPNVNLPSPKSVVMDGVLGTALRRGVERLAKDPYSEKWLRADVSFEIERIFTNYSGDASGRFIELASLTSTPDQLGPPTLPPILRTISQHQKPDGHFGAEVDLTKPLSKGSPPIPMLWGNARLLVGLAAAVQELGQTHLLPAAKRLGDFYVNSADQLCNPDRTAEYQSSGTYGDGYACCYFPAIEGLAMLHVLTKDNRYLKHAERMADFFITRFDVLPVDHSHGNLCAWRGILDLYRITGNRKYLDAAIRKWSAATSGGFVWPIGGIGEHWAVFFHGDEGCSESDWLRFNLDLWRYTGNTRYLDMAERILHNQYSANQTENGGYGWREFDGDAAGPVATSGSVQEWPFCCSFHGPLGLLFLKRYLAAASERGVYVNFPLDYSATVSASERDWHLYVKTTSRFRNETVSMRIELAPKNQANPVRSTLFVRMPQWANDASITNDAGDVIAAPIEAGYLRIARAFRAGQSLIVTFETSLSIEARRFASVRPPADRISRLQDVTVFSGPRTLLAERVPAPGRPVLLAQVTDSGTIDLPRVGEDAYGTVALSGGNAGEVEIAQAIESARPILMRPWSEVRTRARSAFAVDLVVVPRGSPALKSLAALTKRAVELSERMGRPIYGENLEKRPELWLANASWRFDGDWVHVTGGDIGLMDGVGYTDYRFECDVVLPKEGQGIAGVVVRAASEADCVMFQIQSADSSYNAPEFKTRPNTLRPHVRKNGQWTIAEPVALPVEIRRGEKHRLAMECRGERVEVLLDGRKIHGMTVGDHGVGGVGFRAAGPGEQGVFSRISLIELRSR